MVQEFHDRGPGSTVGPTAKAAQVLWTCRYNQRRHAQVAREVFAKFSQVFRSFGRVRDVFGPVRTFPDAFGRVRMRSGAFGSVCTFSEIFENFRARAKYQISSCSHPKSTLEIYTTRLRLSMIKSTTARARVSESFTQLMQLSEG